MAAQILDDFPASKSARYPWTEWLDGRVWRLEKGTDFTSRTETFLVNARTQAQRKGGRLQTRTLKEGDGEAVVLRFQAK